MKKLITIILFTTSLPIMAFEQYPTKSECIERFEIIMESKFELGRSEATLSRDLNRSSEERLIKTFNKISNFKKKLENTIKEFETYCITDG